MSSALMANYRRSDIAVSHGEGAILYATDGRRFLDFGAGIAVSALGHSHPHLVAALKAQAERVWHCSNLYQIPEQERLAERLVAATFADAAFFCNSGAEAVEAALKLARKYHDIYGAPQRYRVVTFEGAFHGRTLAAIAAGGSEKLLAGFEPTVDGFDQVPFGDLAAARAAIGPDTAAVLIEPIQGEGGIRVAEPWFLRGLRELADETGVLLMLDEVQTGVGRTGHLFAHEAAGVVPDVMAIAKGLGGGFPIGACLARGNAARTFQPGNHGTTFGGNPLASAVANAVLDVVLVDGFLDRVQGLGDRLHAGLIAIAGRRPGVIAAVRGQGLMIGIKCADDAGVVLAEFVKCGLLAVPAAENVIRLLPPLTVLEDQVDEALEIIDQACTALTDRAA